MKTDVVVVGGGPVGLWVACELKLAGIDVVVLERRTERVNESRALTIHGRTLEMFALRGLEKRFLENGTPVPTGHFAVLDTRLDFRFIDSTFPYTLFIPQRRTEQLIEDRALELGVEIRRGVMVDRIDQTADSCTVSGTSSSGPLTVEAAYIVGADGVRSAVRGAAGIDFPGHAGDSLFMLADAVLNAKLPAPVISKVNEHGCAMIAPLGDGRHHRIVLIDADQPPVKKTTPLTLEEIATTTQKILGFDPMPSDPIWLSRFDNETRLAASYRNGRILLAGDAAHMHLPAGGQGMNVGLQDAMNLGWKLALVCKGEAPDSLLDSYGEERRAVGLYLHDNTLSQSALLTSFTPDTLALRSTLNELLSVPEANQHIALQISGFGVRYDQPLLEKGDLGTNEGAMGRRISDAPLILEDGTETTIFTLLSAGKWLLLTQPQVSTVTVPDWLPADAVVTARARDLRAAGSLAGLGAILIRPDGYSAGVASA